MAGQPDPYDGAGVGGPAPGGPYGGHGAQGRGGRGGRDGSDGRDGRDGYREPAPGRVPGRRVNGYDHARPPAPARPRVSPLRLWTGGAAVAAVAALASALALLLVRGVLGVEVLAPERHATMRLASGSGLVLGAAGAALVGTAVLWPLLLFAARPARVLGWLVTSGTAAAMLVALAGRGSGDPAARWGTALVYLAVGTVVGTLMGTVARWAVRD